MTAEILSSESTTRETPAWVWWAAAGGSIASLLAAIVYFARRPSYDRMIRRTGAPEIIVTLAAIQRYTESRGNPKSGLGQPELFPWWAEPRNASRAKQEAESAAAARGYEYNRKSYGESPYPKKMWSFGSGGPYGLLPSTALGPWRGTDAIRSGKLTPYDVFNPWRATVFFVDYAHRLTTKELDELPARYQTLLALKRGMASPKLVRDVDESEARSRQTRENTEKAIAALELDPAVLHARIPLEWPDYPGARELLP